MNKRAYQSYMELIDMIILVKEGKSNVNQKYVKEFLKDM